MFRIKHLLTFSFVFALSAVITAGDLYWVGGSGNWDDKSHWSVSSGGKASGILPAKEDNVIFDVNSFPAGGVLTIKNTSECKNFTWKNLLQPVTIEGSGALTINGSVRLHQGVKNNFTGTIYFVSAESETITSAENSFPGKLVFDGEGKYELSDNLISPLATIIVNRGVFSSNNKKINCAAFISNSNESRNILFGTSVVSVEKKWEIGSAENLIFENNDAEILLNKESAMNFSSSGKIVYKTLSIKNPPPTVQSHTVTTSSTNVTCNQLCNGTASANVAGGTGPFGYSWSPGGQTTQSISNLCAGTYIVAVTDSFDNEVVLATATITEPAAYVIFFSGTTPATCNTLCNGKTTAVVGGGTSPYTYSWNPTSQTTAQATGLCAGTYTLSITDANSCPTTRTVTITQPNVLLANGSSQNISCNGVCDGTATMAPTGGTTPYTYSWTTGATTAGVSNLCVGVYTGTVTDKNGCQSVYTTTVSEPLPLTITTSSVNVTCGGLCNATAGVVPSGGTSPYTYSWSPGGQATSSVTGLCAGTFTITVNDTKGCTVSQTVIITEPAPLTSVPTATNVTCKGLCDGIADANAAGGTAPYTYSWSNSTTNSTATGLCPGTYTVTVTDFSLCVTTGTITITEPLILAANASLTNVSCSGLCDGSVTSAPTGGTVPYTYLWGPGGETTASVTGLCAGTYSVSVTDANNCLSTGTVTVTQPAPLTGGTSQTNLLCNGSCIGTASVTPAGGTAPYTYAWLPGGMTSQLVTGLCAGTYTATVRDANNCVFTTTVSITQPNALTVTITSNSVTCNAACTGSAAANAAGGTAPFTYAWLPGGQTTSTITNLCAGTYSVTVRDANGCTGTQTVIIDEPTALSGTLTATDASCNGICDGTASVVASGGTASYTYSWNPGGETTANITGLCDGTYTVTITDANSCTYTSTVTVTEPNILNANPSATNISCAGLCDGVLTAAPTGGTGPYAYSWSAGGQTTQSISNLCAGAYNVLVTDANGCQDNDAISITQPLVLNAALGTIVNTCSSCTGSAQIVASGGTSPYTYSWSDGQTTATASNLCLGTYTITVTDANGCTATNVATINQIVNISITISSPNISCFGACDGIATANPSGGNSPYTYSWTPGGLTNQTITGLCAGTYTVSVQDSLGCFNSDTVTLTEPALLTLSLTPTNTSCNGACDGSIVSAPAGGTLPYTYAWLPGNETTTSISALCAGDYTLTVRDANGCIATSTVTITEAPPIVANPTVTDATCLLSDGGITLAPTGGTGAYTFSWSPGGETTQNITNLFAGTYTITITDAAGCTSATTVNVNNPTGPTVASSQTDVDCFGNCNGVGSVTVTAGNSPYSYLWAPGGQTTTSETGLCVGTYNVRVTDNLGCITIVAITITEPAIITPTVSITNVSCGGLCDGSASIAVGGGTSPYSYSWTPGGQTTSSLTGLCAGTYVVDITDNNLCVYSETVTITEPAVLSLTVTGTDALCNGLNNGGAVANVAGGSAPYTYSWSPGGQIVSTITNLSPGTYTVDVTDANSCAISGTVTIGEPPILTSTVTGTNISCNALCDGDATVAASGGTGPYTYSWNPSSQTTTNATGLCAATYSAVVTDNNGCVVSNTITITEPAAFSFGFSQTNVTCNGDCDGQISTNVTGGSSPYTYLWSPGSETTTGISSLCAGTYTLLVTDANLCTASQTATITEPNLLLSNTSSANTSCAGVCDGSATSTPVGGTSPFTYLWSPGAQTTATATGLCAGTYTILVTDANNCTDEQSVVVSDPTPITIIPAVAGANCGVCNGAITVVPSGGTGSTYTYLWSPGGETTATVTGLCAGMYTVSVTDSLSCAYQFTITLSNTSGPTGETITHTHVTCNGACDGASSIVPIGGTTPYTYLWNPGGQTTNSLTGLCAGIYIIQVTDSNGCIRFAQDTILEPLPLASNALIASATCNGICDGAVSLAPSGGTGSYTYAWLPGGETTASITGACAGTYTVNITDSLGCVLVDNPVVGQNTIITVTVVSTTNVSCNGNCDGIASVTASGGTGPYNYLWSDPLLQTDTIATGLCAGTYTVTITDFNGCIATQTIVITEPATLTLNPSITDASCGLCNGIVTLAPSGGTTPYTYTWSDGQSTATATGLCAGVYNVLVTDSNGCTTSAAQLISNNGGPTGENIVTTSVNCNGDCDGTGSITPIGGTAPYTYLWLTGGYTSNSVTGLCGGTYFVQITDSNNCVRTTSLTIAEPAAFATNDTVIDATCGLCDGSISLAPSGGTGPYTYSWSPGGETTSAITSLCAGVYTLTLTDAVGCDEIFTMPISNPTGPSVGIVVTDVTCNASCNGTATANVSGGNPPFTYSWSTGQTSSSISGLCAGTYFLQVTDASSCVTITTYTVNEPSAITFSTPIISNPVCNSGCNGSATVLAFGGTLPYNYSWNTGNTTNSDTGLCASLYSILVTDQQGCTSSITIALSNIGGPTGETITTTSVSCYGACDGAANITPIGGTPPYNYLWVLGGQTTSSVTGLCGGNYFVQIQDSNGCVRTTSLSIAEPAQFNINQTVVSANCGLCDGSITLNTTGGTLPYTYSWSPGGETTSSITGLCAGVYSTTITDASGCPQQFTIPVNNPSGPTVSYTVTDVSCNGTCDGAITTALIGNSPFTYSWSNGTTDAAATGLCAGNYFVQVTDNSNCITIATVTVVEPALLVYNLPVSSSPLCNGDCNGTITTIPFGGTAPYTYAWLPTGGTASAATGLCAGTYTITLSDNNGCTANQITTLTEPDSIIVSSSVTDATCSNGSDGAINITVSGGTAPYTYQWVLGSAATSEDLINISPGTYAVLVTDANGCTTTDTMIVNSTIIVDAIAGNDTTFCEGDSVILNGSTSVGLTYNWYRIPSPLVIDTSLIVKVKPFTGTNTYMLVVYNGACTDTDYVVVTSLSLPVADAGNDVTIFTNSSATIGGSPTGPSGSTIRWSPSIGLSDTTIANPVASHSLTTTYTVTVTNSNGCSSTDTIRVTVLPKIVFPNGISPNADGKNDEWIIDNINKFPDAVVEVYNRWGELLFRSVGYTTRFDGTYNGKPLPVGTYYYIINLNDPEFPDAYTGPLTIMR